MTIKKMVILLIAVIVISSCFSKKSEEKTTDNKQESVKLAETKEDTSVKDKEAEENENINKEDADKEEDICGLWIEVFPIDHKYTKEGANREFFINIESYDKVHVKTKDFEKYGRIEKGGYGWYFYYDDWKRDLSIVWSVDEFKNGMLALDRDDFSSYFFKRVEGLE